MTTIATFKSWDVECIYDDETGETSKPYQDDILRYLNHRDLSRLNVIGLTYHSAFGYDQGDHVGDDFDELVSIVPGLITLGDPESDAEDSDIVPERPVLFDLKTAHAVALFSQIPHRKVILRLGPVGKISWYNRPPKVTRTWFSGNQTVKDAVYWYNFPFDHNPKLNKNEYKFLPPLLDRPYITVNELFEEIMIDSVMKSLPITYDDIYFASRGLCCDDTRGSFQYHVMSDDGSTLTLMLEVDNFST
jgi:hypothetical protein